MHHTSPDAPHQQHRLASASTLTFTSSFITQQLPNHERRYAKHLRSLVQAHRTDTAQGTLATGRPSRRSAQPRVQTSTPPSSNSSTSQDLQRGRNGAASWELVVWRSWAAALSHHQPRRRPLHKPSRLSLATWPCDASTISCFCPSRRDSCLSTLATHRNCSIL